MTYARFNLYPCEQRVRSVFGSLAKNKFVAAYKNGKELQVSIKDLQRAEKEVKFAVGYLKKVAADERWNDAENVEVWQCVTAPLVAAIIELCACRAVAIMSATTNQEADYVCDMTDALTAAWFLPGFDRLHEAIDKLEGSA